MKKILLSLALTMCCMLAGAQENTVTGDGLGSNGNYRVKVAVNVKKKLPMPAEDLVMKYAVEGVMFRGVMSTEGYGDQKPIIKDPNVQQTKPEFFTAFNNEKAYKRYCNIVPGTLVSIKNKQTKMIETTAIVLVDHASLQQYLEKSGIVKGFSNLW